MWTLTALLSCLACLASGVPVYYDRMPSDGRWQQDWVDIFVVNITVGHPAVNYNITLDLEIFESLLLGAQSTPPQCRTSNRRYFVENHSTTFRVKSEGKFMVYDYMQGHGCVGSMPDPEWPTANQLVGSDDVTFNGLGTFRKSPFGVFDAFNGSWNEQWPSDGVLGLAPLADTPQPQAPSLVKALVSQLGKKNCPSKAKQADLCNTASLYLPGNRIRGQVVGGIEFGPVSSRCGAIKIADQGTDEDWNFFVENATLGATTSPKNLGKKGFFELKEWSLLKMPVPVMEDFMRQIGATFNTTEGPLADRYDSYYVECSSVPRLPSLTVNLRGGVTLRFPATEYIDVTPVRGTNLCNVLLRGSKYGVPSYWAFGSRVAHSNCVVLNFQNSKVGFGPIGHQ